MDITKLQGEVQALEKELNLDETAKAAVVDGVKSALSTSVEAQAAYTKLSEVQARARIHEVTLQLANLANEGAILSALAIYQTLDSKSVWKRNVSAEVNKDEFLKANLDGGLSQPNPKDKVLTLTEFRLFVKNTAETLMPFLQMRERADYEGLKEYKKELEEVRSE